MKKLTFLMTGLILSGISQLMAQQPQAASKEVNKGNGPVASYDLTVYDMGEIELRVPKTATFVLTNNGNEPLIISSAKASCGCTNLQYDKEPVLPKKSVNISATYNAAVPGAFIKTITVVTNASEQPVVLQIKGTVIQVAQRDSLKTQ
jgi:hypothetical protein